MRKQLLSFIFSIIFYSAYAQVGIGTTDPKTTLHVVGNPSDASSLDGITLPRMTGDQLIAKSYTSDQLGTLVYVTAPATNPSGQTSNVIEEGLYIFSSSQNQWMELKSSSSSDDRDDGEGWKLSGNDLNGKLNDGKIFLGTTTYNDLFIKVNNTQIGRFSPGGGVGLGFQSVATANNSLALGGNAVAKQEAVAIGYGATNSNNESIAIGKNASSAFQNVAIGLNAKSIANSAIAIGNDTKATSQNSLAIGNKASTQQNESIAIGSDSQATGYRSLAVGNNAFASNSQANAFGDQATASASSSLALGSGTNARGEASVALGFNSTALNKNSMSLGVGSKANGNNAISIGINSSTTSQNSMAFGNNAAASNNSSIAIGQNSQATAVRSVALGNGVRAFGKNSVAIGYGAKADQDNTIILGNGSRVGIATFAPDHTTKLHVKGSVRIEDGTQGAGKVLTSDTNGKASWQASAAVTVGDVKHGFQPKDHNGWYLLDGRSISSLPANAKAAASSLGFSGNLPNATNRVLKAPNGAESLGSQVGNNSIKLSQANIPNYDLAGTTSTDGDHSHTYTDSGNNSKYVTPTILFGTNVANNTDVSKTTNNAGSHNHTVSINSGGSGTAIDSTPASIVTNVFVYLGN